MLEVTGPDAAAYLDAHLTVLRRTRIASGALLTPKGTLLGLLRIEPIADGFRLYSGQPASRRRAGARPDRLEGRAHAVHGTTSRSCPTSNASKPGIPAFGRDIDERTLPHEAGLVGTVVRTDKNVYPGMQTVLRQQRSGTVHRALRRLALEAPVQAGTEVRDEAGSLGTIGTAVVSPTRGPLALALLRRRAEPGTRVRVGEVSGIVEP